MNITVEELKQLAKDSYQIIDIRDEVEIAHGEIPGAIACKQDGIIGNGQIDFTKELIICCSRGRFSVDVAEELRAQGFRARSLTGGYVAWLLDLMKEEEAKVFAKDVE